MPVVDISRWFEADVGMRRRVAAEVDAACREVGFFAIGGHGLPDELITAMLDSVTELFALPDDVKRRYVPLDKSVNRGYAPYGSEALAYSLGVDTPPDLFEAFNVGTEPADPAAPYYARERHRFFAPNIWPDELPAMRRIWQTYFAACDALAADLDRIFAVALGLPSDFVRRRTSRAANVMRVNHYERRAGHPAPVTGQMRMGAHTDYGVCTILLADPVPGLQILGPGGTWHDVMPEPGTLLVNLGDLLAEWTNDRWRSTLHRVVPPPESADGPVRRRSVAFFHEADYDAVIEVMPTCIDDEHPAKYPPVTAGEHLLAKLVGPRTLVVAQAMQTATTDRDVLTGRS